VVVDVEDASELEDDDVELVSDMELLTDEL